MPRSAITAAVTATNSASMPWKPCTQPLAGSSSGGARKIRTVPRRQEEREADPLPLLRPGAERRQEHEQLRGMDHREAEEAVRVERTLSSPLTYAVMKYAWKKTPTTTRLAGAKLIQRNALFMPASLRDPPDSLGW